MSEIASVLLFIVRKLLICLDLLESLRRGYTPEPEVEVMKFPFDIKEWMGKNLVDLHNLNNPHRFIFFINEKKEVLLKYKQWCGDKEWYPKTCQGLKIIEVCLFFFNNIALTSI